MATRPASVQAYLASLPADRREAFEAIRRTILDNIDPAFAEGIQYGMVGYFLPHSAYPAGYHCNPEQPLPFALLASQKHHIVIHLCSIYGDSDEARRFRDEWLATGKRLDMGKGCVRVRTLEEVPLEVIGRMMRRVTAKKFVAQYEATLGQQRGRKKTGKKAAAKKQPARAAGAQRTARRRA